ncbi:phosphotransferase enzyme family protein [Tumebacillus flagellatus]|uniref:Aminoglycoside phosphotransferase domain-containing protein n=1 Tax=Tumebacillus flagellatus TaxID=1157490 RepID=A0A074MCS3_9BACL|nr:phosphotransferase [Tumebacillus flagellatus]KEO83672.1 hypothetical protein EL26_08430 [Tumebacillus flagellatus]
MKNLLAKHYGLLNADISRLPLGAVNRNFLVHAEGQAYVLKQYATASYTPEHIAHTCDVQFQLREAGLPVPEILRNKAGEWITPIEAELPVSQTMRNRAGEGNATGVEAVRSPSHETEGSPSAGTGFLVLSRFVSGEHQLRGSISEKAAYNSGVLLARLHEQMSAMPNAKPFAMKPLQDALRDTESLLHRAEQVRRRSAVDETACAVLRYKLQAMKQLEDLSAVSEKLPAQWVHGDYHEVNLLFTPEQEVAAVFDFDNLRCMPRGLEFMRSLSLMFSSGPRGLEEGAYAFFEGYARYTNDLTEAELALYVPLRRYYALTRHWPIQQRYETPDLYDERWDKFITPPSDWWEVHGKTVTERLLHIWARCQRKTLDGETSF